MVVADDGIRAWQGRVICLGGVCAAVCVRNDKGLVGALLDRCNCTGHKAVSQRHLLVVAPEEHGLFKAEVLCVVGRGGHRGQDGTQTDIR